MNLPNASVDIDSLAKDLRAGSRAALARAIALIESRRGDHQAAAREYAEGKYVAYVPWETLKPYLTPEGAKIFGGARPKGDDDGPQ